MIRVERTNDDVMASISGSVDSLIPEVISVLAKGCEVISDGMDDDYEGTMFAIITTAIEMIQKDGHKFDINTLGENLIKYNHVMNIVQGLSDALIKEFKND